MNANSVAIEDVQSTTNCIFTDTSKLPVYHSDSYFFDITSVFNLSRNSCLGMLCKMAIDVISVQYRLVTYRESPATPI